ncbi:unnamed protein product [Allacma fusca]|uniref:Uncharacterized protein n=1 Tax=Allacma fusca TaxID=39272 RepID=A0A8J2LVB4_9HEXA|nr:unnamed protein product [Allacma fusca]
MMIPKTTTQIRVDLHKAWPQLKQFDPLAPGKKPILFFTQLFSPRPQTHGAARSHECDQDGTCAAPGKPENTNGRATQKFMEQHGPMSVTKTGPCCPRNPRKDCLGRAVIPSGGFETRGGSA